METFEVFDTQSDYWRSVVQRVEDRGGHVDEAWKNRGECIAQGLTAGEASLVALMTSPTAQVRPSKIEAADTFSLMDWTRSVRVAHGLGLALALSTRTSYRDGLPAPHAVVIQADSGWDDGSLDHCDIVVVDGVADALPLADVGPYNTGGGCMVLAITVPGDSRALWVTRSEGDGNPDTVRGWIFGVYDYDEETERQGLMVESMERFDPDDIGEVVDEIAYIARMTFGTAAVGA